MDGLCQFGSLVDEFVDDSQQILVVVCKTLNNVYCDGLWILNYKIFKEEGCIIINIS